MEGQEYWLVPILRQTLSLFLLSGPHRIPFLELDSHDLFEQGAWSSATCLPSLALYILIPLSSSLQTLAQLAQPPSHHAGITTRSLHDMTDMRNHPESEINLERSRLGTLVDADPLIQPQYHQ